jgi:L-lysine 2,3-aminomutase
MNIELTETEIEPGYLWKTDLTNGLRRVVVQRRRQCERMGDTTGLLRSLADALDEINQTEKIKVDGCIVAAWLVDHVVIDSYNGDAIAYLRSNA